MEHAGPGDVVTGIQPGHRLLESPRRQVHHRGIGPKAQRLGRRESPHDAGRHQGSASDTRFATSPSFRATQDQLPFSF